MNTDIEDRLFVMRLMNLVRFQPHLTSENIIQEIDHFKKEVSIRSCGRRNDPRIVKLICKHHRHLRHEVMESPCRFRCRVCEKMCAWIHKSRSCFQSVWIFVFGTTCTDCSISTSKCMWCSRKSSENTVP